MGLRKALSLGKEHARGTPGGVRRGKGAFLNRRKKGIPAGNGVLADWKHLLKSSKAKTT